MGRIKREDWRLVVVCGRRVAGRTRAILAVAGARRAAMGDGISANRAALLSAAPGRSQKSSRAKEKPKKQKRVSSRTRGDEDEALAAGPGPATAGRAMGLASTSEGLP